MPPKKHRPTSGGPSKKPHPKDGGGAMPQPVIGFAPPGTGHQSRNRHNVFEQHFEEHFRVPRRLHDVPMPLVEAVNDFHYAMMNDTPRNQFYYEILKKHVTPETGVLEIGAGSGLLSMMAAQLGAKWVVAVEGSEEMSRLAARNVEANNLQDKVKVYHMMSTDLQAKHLPGTPDILVSEIFGTLLLGESALDYIADIRRLLGPKSVILPRHGVQYAVPIECPTLDSICSVKSWNGLDLSHVTAVKDTVSTVFTKKYGFRMSSVPFKELAAPVPVATVDFLTTPRNFLPARSQRTIKATEDGTVHAMLLYWVATDGDQVMSTNPRDTLENFPRDMQWGQALQLIDAGNEKLPQDFNVVKDTEYNLVTRCSYDSVILQFELQNIKAPKEPAPAVADRK